MTPLSTSGSHRRATLPPGLPGSTIAEAGLNFRVRNGNGCGPCSMDGGIDSSAGLRSTEYFSGPAIERFGHDVVKPHGRLVPVSSTHCCASTSGLSTSWSRTALQGTCVPGDLFLGWASHLDAFSGYPFRTWLPGGAAGATTGTP